MRDVISLDQHKRDQAQGHITRLEGLVVDAEAAAEHPEGDRREQAAALAARLRGRLDALRDEAAALEHPPAAAPAGVDASARD